MTAPGILRELRPDPLLEGVPLPLSQVFYPLGCRLELSTNSNEVLLAASESWGMDAAEFCCDALQFRVVVQDGGALAPEPSFRARGPLFAIVSDKDNFGVFDAAGFSGFCFASRLTVADHEWFRWCFLESIVYMMLSQRYVVPVHAAFVARNGKGILLCGRSGAGKSTLAFASAREGWTYLSDDATFLLPGTGEREAIGKPHKIRFREDAPHLFPELSSYSAKLRPNGRFAIEPRTDQFPNIQSATRARIHHVIFLDRWSESRSQLSPVDSRTAAESLLADMPLYDAAVNQMHESTLRQLAGVPAWRARYRDIRDAVMLLNDLVGK